MMCAFGWPGNMSHGKPSFGRAEMPSDYWVAPGGARDPSRHVTPPARALALGAAGPHPLTMKTSRVGASHPVPHAFGRKGLRAFAATILLSPLLACVPAAGSAGPLKAPERFTVEFRRDAAVTRREVRVPPERVWALMPGVYDDLGLPSAPGSDATGERLILTPMMRIRGPLYENERTSDYLDCGTSMARGPIADAYEVNFALITRVIPAANGTLLEIIVDGHARDRTQPGTPVPCVTRGKFEEQIVAYLMQRVRRSRT